MTRDTILSDDLVRDLVATGRVDVLVGLPTLDNAATVGSVVEAVHTCFSTALQRERTVLLNLDGGSTDATVEVVRSGLAQSEAVLSARPLRTIHRISRPYHGLPGKGGALRTLLAAAELVGARAIVLVDADVTSIEPSWVARLARPILDNQADYVAPLFDRHPLEGPFVSQLLRPVVRMAYGRSPTEPLASEFACSEAFAAHCLGDSIWDSPIAKVGIDLWLTLNALAGRYRVVQTHLGPRVQAPTPRKPAFTEVFPQVAGALLDCMEWHAPLWLAHEGPSPIPTVGDDRSGQIGATLLDPGPMSAAFRIGVTDLDPILTLWLERSTLAHLRGICTQREPLHFPDMLWICVVHEALAALRSGRVHRDFILQSLLPLYLGRAASFLLDGGSNAAIDGAVEALARGFQESRPRLVETWSREPR